MMKKIEKLSPLLTALMAVLPVFAAQAQTSSVPNAGSMLQQAQPNATFAPGSSAAPASAIDRGENNAGGMPESAPFLVKTLNITGNKKIDTATLHALVADVEGKSVTLTQLDKAISRISEYYTSHGYPLARAIIPAQTITDGVVTIQIIVARYGQISLSNRSRASETRLQSTLSPLQSGQEIEQKYLDRTLLLLSDLPGVVVNSSLKPGEAVGTSDLLVSTTASPRLSGNVVLDNYGNNFTGTARVGATANLVDPLNLKTSDTLSVSVLTSGNGLSSGLDGGMGYGRIAYESVLNGLGSRLGAAYSALNYKLGGSAASSQSDGTAQVASVWVKHPLIRQRELNLYAQVQFDGLKLSDKMNAGTLTTDRQLSNWTFSLAGDARDEYLMGGINTWNVGVSTGRNDFVKDALSNLANDPGAFAKVNYSFARLQSAGDKNSVYLSLVGQWADKNLDSSQKMTVGGPNTVRAFDTGAVSGDEGQLLSVEFRHDLGAAWDGQLQGVWFYDAARMNVNKNPLSTATDNIVTLGGAGMGFNWAGPNQWSAKTYVATPMGSVPASLNTPSANATRAWVEMGKGF